MHAGRRTVRLNGMENSRALEESACQSVASLALALVDMPSVSGEEGELADAVEELLVRLSRYEVLRERNTIVARTHLGRSARILLAGHLDTVPIAGNVPGAVRDGQLWGRGSVDMKAGDAVFLQLARELAEPRVDLTYVFYDNEEVEAVKNGLGRVSRTHPEWLEADLAVLGEPTNGGIEGGCNGTLRVQLVAHGKAAHSARPWRGVNAIHALGEALRRLESYEPEIHAVDGLEYRESLLAVAVSGGRTLNSVPDEATLTVNFRFAPDRSEDDAVAHVRQFFAGLPLDVVVTDSAPAARPGMDHPEFAELAEHLRGFGAPPPVGKLGWTDVARFSALGIPAINCGPGDPLLAHQDDEACPMDQIEATYRAFVRWLD